MAHVEVGGASRRVVSGTQHRVPSVARAVASDTKDTASLAPCVLENSKVQKVVRRD